MKTFRNSIITVIILGALRTAGLASSVTIEAGTVRAAAGAKVEVPVNLKGAQKLGALQLELAYDPAILETQDRSVEKGGFPQEISIGSHVIAPGLVRLVMNGPAGDSISGDGTLMRAVFTVKGQAGEACDLRITSARAWDNTAPSAIPAEMLVTLAHGEFTVGMAIPLWLKIAAGVLALLLIIMLRQKAKSRAAKMPPPVPAPVQSRQQPMPPPLPGAVAATGGKFCTHCGAPAPAGARFCGACGKPV